MPIYEFTQSEIIPVELTSFSANGFLERKHIQKLLRENVHVIAPDTLIIAEEFGDWDDSRRRIDLLGVDKTANLVVIELKRNDDGGHMDLQAIRYAAMVSKMTFGQAADIYSRYLADSSQPAVVARDALLEHLEWDGPDDAQFGQDVRIVLASADFSKEITSSVMWLNERDLDIRCVRLRPYKLDDRLLVDVQQIIPLPEAAEYQVQVREKTRKEREARESGADFTRFDLMIGGEPHSAQWKRNAIFLVVQKLCRDGTDPAKIVELLDWRPNHVWYKAEGDLDSDDFVQVARNNSDGGGQKFDPRRWFCATDELVRYNGQTLAFSKMWGGEQWHLAMKLLKEAFPALEIDFRPTTS